MSDKNLLENIKKLREMTGVGFKDCKIALDEKGVALVPGTSFGEAATLGMISQMAT